VKPHWEKLVLRRWTDGELYQEGPVYGDALARGLCCEVCGLRRAWAMFCGTLAAKGGIRPGKVFRMELRPVLSAS
jgi:hypothetical protein